MRLVPCVFALLAATAHADDFWNFTATPCDPDPKVVARIDAMALELAKKVAPSAEVERGCAVVKGVAFVKFKNVEVESGGVTFILPMSLVGAGPAAKVKPVAKPGQWKLQLAVKPDALEPFAKRILAEPLTALAHGASPVECFVERSVQDAHVIGFLCGPVAREPNAWTPSMGDLPFGPRALEFLLHEPKKGCDCPAFFLDKFNVPIAMSDEQMPGFCLLPATSRLKALAQQRPLGWIQLTRGEGGRELVVQSKSGTLREKVEAPTTTACQVLPACPAAP